MYKKKGTIQNKRINSVDFGLIGSHYIVVGILSRFLKLPIRRR